MLTVSAYFEASLPTASGSESRGGIRIYDFSMLEMMQILHDEVGTPGLSTAELVGAIGNILRIKLLRLMSQQARSPSVGKPCRSVDVAMLHALINHKGARMPTTAELAEKFQLDRRGLLRLCKGRAGMPPSRYIERTKLERAKTLLVTSTLTMKQIAYEAGYSTANMENGPLLILGRKKALDVAIQRSGLTDRGALVVSAATPRRENIPHKTS